MSEIIPPNFEEELDKLVDLSIREAVLKIIGPSSISSIRVIPGITNYVYELVVNDQEYIAKYNFMGLSKVSLLKSFNLTRIPDLSVRQYNYTHLSDTSLQIEMCGTEFLNNLNFPTSRCVGYSGGVLLKEKIDGETLQDAFINEQINLEGIYSEIYSKIRRLWQEGKVHSTRTVVSEICPLDTCKTDLIVNFHKKNFSPLISRCPSLLTNDFSDLETTPSLFSVIISFLDEIENSKDCLIYGDLKPENILLSPQKIFFIDPDIHLGNINQDIAKLISRSSLLGLYPEISVNRKREIALELGNFIHLLQKEQFKDFPHLESQVIILCVVDLLLILNSYSKINPSTLSEYPYNVRENYVHTEKIVSLLSQVFNLDKKEQVIRTLNNFVKLFFENGEGKNE